MIGWLVRIFMVIAGSITSWFVAHDSLKFNIIQMVIAILLITLVLFIAAFWQSFWYWIKRIRKRS
ncbi:hypothetical protein [Legionella maioricensis]|uniref:Uncharacterized protein n=1 Tax=Legionella maioricensis TaxID=2896528 RepID=A0A9X2D2D9_9GAMM|nr:hypothetical protein [Legionella maioricensis]MCL9685049.1 hypothetical protein [Legionella maioricensis]MCL9688190.1 hypothetical protein [Legionella maioricensis]